MEKEEEDEEEKGEGREGERGEVTSEVCSLRKIVPMDFPANTS
jgi:hypothetical protein